jgi:hypothetical protein
MSPHDFDRAWKARNQRLEDGGVFAHLTELEERYGWGELEKLTPSELINAVRGLSGDSQTTDEAARNSD